MCTKISTSKFSSVAFLWKFCLQKKNYPLYGIAHPYLYSHLQYVSHLPFNTYFNVIWLHHHDVIIKSSIQQQHNDDKVMVRTTVDTLLEGYLGNQQSLSRGVKYCHSLLTSQHVPSATLLYHLATRLMSDQLVSHANHSAISVTIYSSISITYMYTPKFGKS